MPPIKGPARQDIPLGHHAVEPSSAHRDPPLQQQQVPHPSQEEASDGSSRENMQWCSICPGSPSNLIGKRGMEGINLATLSGREHLFQGGRQLIFQGPALELNLGH